MLKANSAKNEAAAPISLFYIIFVSRLLIGFTASSSVLGTKYTADLAVSTAIAVAGALVLLVLAVEMIFGVEIFKNDSPCGSATIVPLVFPLIAGAASFTTLLSLRAEYNILNIIIAVAMNMALVYLVLRYVYYVERLFGKSGVYVMRKLFGIILLAIAVRLFTSNLTSLIGSF